MANLCQTTYLQLPEYGARVAVIVMAEGDVFRRRPFLKDRGAVFKEPGLVPVSDSINLKKR